MACKAKIRFCTYVIKYSPFSTTFQVHFVGSRDYGQIIMGESCTGVMRVSQGFWGTREHWQNIEGNKGTLAIFGNRGTKFRKITVRKHSERVWGHGNIGQFWKGTREQGHPPPPPPWETLNHVSKNPGLHTALKLAVIQQVEKRLLWSLPSVEYLRSQMYHSCHHSLYKMSQDQKDMFCSA